MAQMVQNKQNWKTEITFIYSLMKILPAHPSIHLDLRHLKKEIQPCLDSLDKFNSVAVRTYLTANIGVPSQARTSSSIGWQLPLLS